MNNRLRRRSYTARRIRDAVNTLPWGLCFFRYDGRPILVNKVMNEVAFRLTGRTMLNVYEFWDAACRCRIDMKIHSAAVIQDSENTVQVRFPDDRVWQIRRTGIGAFDGSGNEIIQLDAADITDLYRTVSEYNEKNLILKRQYHKLKEISRETVKLNTEKELLRVKSEIHNEFGECIAAMMKSLESGDDSSADELLASWREVIARFSNIADSSVTTPAPEEELMRVAEMINCEVLFEGRLPENMQYRQLLCTAVREALSNGVRHSGASAVRIAVSDENGALTAEISDNGTNKPETVREGTGLTNLRKRLEEAGVTLTVCCEYGRGVVLKLKFPKEDISYV